MTALCASFMSVIYFGSLMTFIPCRPCLPDRQALAPNLKAQTQNAIDGHYIFAMICKPMLQIFESHLNAVFV